jgi:hypothetical protein
VGLNLASKLGSISLNRPIIAIVGTCRIDLYFSIPTLGASNDKKIPDYYKVTGNHCCFGIVSNYSLGHLIKTHEQYFSQSASFVFYKSIKCASIFIFSADLFKGRFKVDGSSPI